MKDYLKNFDWQKNGILVAFAIFVLYGVLFQGEVFGDPLVWRNLLKDNADIGLIALGMTFVIIAGGIDLSVGSMMALLGVLGLRMMGDGSTAVGVAVMVVGGAALGLTQGLVVTWGKVAPFVATLVGLLVFRSGALVIANGGTMRSENSNWANLASEGVVVPFLTGRNGQPVEIYWSTFLFLGVALVMSFVLVRTPFGRRLVAVGSNERAAHYSAVNVAAVRTWSYVILGVCTGLAAWVNSSKLNSVSTSNAGQLFELEAIAAVVIGGTALAGGKGRILGTVVGVLFLGMISPMLVATDVSTYLQGVVKGLIILVAVLMSRKRGD